MDFLKDKIVYLSISWVLFLVSLFLLFVPKLNLWIDMTWWTQAEYWISQKFEIKNFKKELQEESKKIVFEWKNIINSINSYFVTWENQIVIITWFDNSISEKQLDKLKISFRNKTLNILKKYDKEALETWYTNIWKSFWDYIKNTAFLTLIIAIIAIAIYITYAFSWVVVWISIWSFSLITIITLLHDVILSSGAYILVSTFLPEFKIDTFFVTALLTILWYSINDTIVIFDRIRANLILFWWKKWKEWKNLYEIINLSINESLLRSIYTSLTLLFVLIAIFLFWPETIKWFILVMIFWTLFGTYSSIFIASPLLFLVNKNKKLSVYKKIEVKPEDKIVV